MTVIGVQSVTLNDALARDGLSETLRRMADLGYHHLEVSQLPMSKENVETLKAAQTDCGLSVDLLSVVLAGPPGSPTDRLDGDFDKILGDCRTLDVQTLRIGLLPLGIAPDAGAVLDYCQQVDGYARRLSDHGISLLLHNHNYEFARYGDGLLLDAMLASAPSVGLELDVYWVQRGGLDPVSTLQRLGDRICAVHLKDYRIAQVPMVTSEGDPLPVPAACEAVIQVAEVGAGNLDIRGIVDASVNLSIPYLFVEQENLYAQSPYGALAMSRANLVDMGYAHLF